jgi:DNA polymerase III subunit gamma/tau
MSLHIDYRPNDLKEIVGNNATIEKLISVLERKKDKPHTYLFQGPRGCGKTTLARIAATKTGCDPNDIKEIDVTTNRGIDSAKELKEKLMYKPLHGKSKAIILDEVHTGTTGFFNALLKPLEEPPKHVYFFLCTTDPQKLLKTVKSRCMIFTVEQLSKPELTLLLKEVVEAEEAIVHDNYLNMIVEKSEGIPREALIMLDSVIDLPEEKIEKALDVIQTQEKQVIDLCRALLAQNKWTQISAILKGVKEEPEKIRWAVIGYMSAVLLGKSKQHKQAANIINEFSEPFFNTQKAGLVKASYMSSIPL